MEKDELPDQIKHLAELAGFPLDMPWHPTEPHCLKKFAELIIQECIYAIDKTSKAHVYTSFDANIVGYTIHESKVAVINHFGDVKYEFRRKQDNAGAS